MNVVNASSQRSLYWYLSDSTDWPLGTYAQTMRAPFTVAVMTRFCSSSRLGMP